MTTDSHLDAPLLRGTRSLSSLSSVGRYGLRRVLGTGPSGTVYAGYDPEDGREVAINLMAAVEPTFEQVARGCVADEARAWGALCHPNIVKVHDVGYYRDPMTKKTGVYVVREMVAGLDLQRWLEARPDFRGSQSWVPLVDMFLEVADALATAHAAGLFHRRFSPASVVVGYDAEIKLLDFGTYHAAPLQPCQREPLYFPAPELARGAVAGAEADQYSFCAALWSALEHATEGRIPKPIAKILARGLQARPEERWPSMEELARQLARRRPWWKRPVTAAFTATAAASALGVWFSGTT